MLERRAGPEAVRRAFYHLRDAGFDNISLDLIYGIPGQSPSDLARDLAEAIALGPEHLSCYELEAKPGTRFTYAHGDELARQAEAMEGYFELVVETLVARRLPLVRDGELLPARTAGAPQPRLLARQGLPRPRDRRGVDGRRPALAEPARASAATSAALARRARRPPRDEEPLEPEVVRRERLMLGLRLDEPLPFARVADGAWTPLRWPGWSGSAWPSGVAAGSRSDRRGRFLGGGVTAELMAESPAKRTI